MEASRQKKMVAGRQKWPPLNSKRLTKVSGRQWRPLVNSGRPSMEADRQKNGCRPSMAAARQ
jgi:hypothetical protein